MNQGFGHRTIALSIHLLVMTFIVGALTFGSRIEPTLFPVLSSIEIEAYSYDDETNDILIVGIMDKERPECTPLEVSFWEKKNGRKYPLKHDFTADDFASMDNTILNTRPYGVQYFGPWKIYGYEKGGKLMMETVHICHILWNTAGNYEVQFPK